MTSEEEPLFKLMQMAQEKLRAGQPRNELVQELILCGMDEEGANAVLDAVVKANNPSWKNLLRLLAPLAIVAGLVYLAFSDGG